MRLIRHERTPKPDEMLLTFNPMTVWLSKTVELKIEKGDSVNSIASVVQAEWKVPEKRAIEIATYWFAIGERVAGGTNRAWTKVELRPDLDRRYLRPKK